MDFDKFRLDPEILTGVTKKGFKEPTPIQAESIPKAIDGHDLLGLAQTGTGKTAAFLLPILQRIHKEEGRHIKSLVLVPTRELAEQVYQDALAFASGTKVKTAAIYGGVSKFPQTRSLRQGVDLIIGCPGRLLDHMRDGNLKLHKLNVLVLDEADTMCDMGFLPDVTTILEQITQEHQTLFFSATMPKEIRDLSFKILKDPATVQVDALAPATTVSHALYPVPPSLKKPLLFHLIKQTPTGKVLVFTRTKYKAKEIAADLKKEGHKTAELQGNLSQNQRQHSMDGFRKGRYDILVATDIAAHGIDVRDVTHVINFDMPGTVDDYTHRIGRTGRALHQGEAFTLAVRTDGAMVKAVERLLGETIERRRLPDFDYGNFYPEDQFSQSGIKSNARTAKPAQRKTRTNNSGSSSSAKRNPNAPGSRKNDSDSPQASGTWRSNSNPHKPHRQRGTSEDVEFSTQNPNSTRDTNRMQNRNQQGPTRTGGNGNTSNSDRPTRRDDFRRGESPNGVRNNRDSSRSSASEPRFLGRHTRSKHTGPSATSNGTGNARGPNGTSRSGSKFTENMFLGKKAGPKQQNQRRSSSGTGYSSQGNRPNSRTGSGPNRGPGNQRRDRY